MPVHSAILLVNVLASFIIGFCVGMTVLEVMAARTADVIELNLRHVRTKRSRTDRPMAA